jgi:hypothetical protein
VVALSVRWSGFPDWRSQPEDLIAEGDLVTE